MLTRVTPESPATTAHPDDAVRRLYTSPPERFVAARKELAATLKAAGRADDAAAVLALRKPTAAAWAVNLLAGERPDDLAELVALGEDLRSAQERLDGAAMRDLGTRRRQVLADLTGAAVEVATSRGNAPSGTVREQIAQTLAAALADPDLGAQVTSGRLVAAGEVAPGLGPVGDAAAPPGGGSASEGAAKVHGKAPTSKTSRSKATAGARAGGAGGATAADAAAARREERERARQEQRRRAQDEAAEAIAAARAATDAVTAAERARDDLAAQVADLRARLRAAEKELGAAEQATTRAARRDEQARVALRAARRRLEALGGEPGSAQTER